VIRTARATDLSRLTALCGELGYPAPESDVARRLSSLLESPSDLILVATDDDDRVNGWLHATVRASLELDPYGQIAGLVVTSASRSFGIGRELVRRAEEWFREKGVQFVRVHSNVLRERAHKFYLREGYEHTKTSRVFIKKL
jgi:GNAT superfamily N-acetyltransferase